MTREEKRLERLHIVATIAEYPNLSSAEVRDRANEECQHDSFDPLPLIAPQGITNKLNALSLDGLISGWQDGETMRWEATDKGRNAVSVYLAMLDTEAAAAHLAETLSRPASEHGTPNPAMRQNLGGEAS